jgi:Leucine-rich repeat (LRR) protein
MIRPVDRTYLASAGWRWLTLMCLLAIGASGGCGGSVSADQKAAMAKIQELGGGVNFKNGGYEIVLAKSAVEDWDLVQLTKIPNLKSLDLEGTRIGDEGIEHLHGISSLEFVSLRTTAVTREGITNLKKALPKIVVTH